MDESGRSDVAPQGVHSGNDKGQDSWNRRRSRRQAIRSESALNSSKRSSRRSSRHDMRTHAPERHPLPGGAPPPREPSIRRSGARTGS